MSKPRKPLIFFSLDLIKSKLNEYQIKLDMIDRQSFTHRKNQIWVSISICCVYLSFRFLPTHHAHFPVEYFDAEKQHDFNKYDDDTSLYWIWRWDFCPFKMRFSTGRHSQVVFYFLMRNRHRIIDSNDSPPISEMGNKCRIIFLFGIEIWEQIAV